jgi:hypothetical protein
MPRSLSHRVLPCRPGGTVAQANGSTPHIGALPELAFRFDRDFAPRHLSLAPFRPDAWPIVGRSGVTKRDCLPGTGEPSRRWGARPGVPGRRRFPKQLPVACKKIVRSAHAPAASPATIIRSVRAGASAFETMPGWTAVWGTAQHPRFRSPVTLGLAEPPGGRAPGLGDDRPCHDP